MQKNKDQCTIHRGSAKFLGNIRLLWNPYSQRPLPNVQILTLSRSSRKYSVRQHLSVGSIGARVLPMALYLRKHGMSMKPYIQHNTIVLNQVVSTPAPDFQHWDYYKNIFSNTTVNPRTPYPCFRNRECKRNGGLRIPKNIHLHQRSSFILTILIFSNRDCGNSIIAIRIIIIIINLFQLPLNSTPSYLVASHLYNNTKKNCP
jgi:hypothetical protein